MYSVVGGSEWRRLFNVDYPLTATSNTFDREDLHSKQITKIPPVTNLVATCTRSCQEERVQRLSKTNKQVPPLLASPLGTRRIIGNPQRYRPEVFDREIIRVLSVV